MLTGHPQGLRRDLFKISFAGIEHGNGIIRHAFVLVLILGQLRLVQDLAAARLAVLLGDRRQFVDDDPFDFCRAVQDILQPGDVRFQVRRFLCTPEDVFAVQVAQLDLSHILCLHLVDAEADHQVGHHLGFLFGLAHNAHSLVDIQQNGLQALEQMQALFLALQIVIRTAAHALGAERGPLTQYLAHAHHTRHARDEDIEIAWETVLQRRHAEQLLHHLVRVLPALEVNGQLEAVEIRLVAHVADLFYAAGFYELGDLVHNGLDRGRGRDLGHLDHIAVFLVLISGAHAHAAPARIIDPADILLIVQDIAAAHEIRCGQGGADVMIRVFKQGNGGLAQLRQVE